MTHRISVGRPVWAYVAALCLGGSAAVASCYNGDQSCGEAYNPNDLGDHCPYGPAGGPKPGAFPADCPAIDPITDVAACNGVSWPAVHAMMLDPNRGNCTNSGQGCHSLDGVGNVDALVADVANPNNPADNGKAFLDALSVYVGGFGTAYPNVVNNDAVPRLYYDRATPSKSWWLCNLKGDAGSLMPQGKPRMAEADILLLQQWLACGAKDDPARSP